MERLKTKNERDLYVVSSSEFIPSPTEQAMDPCAIIMAGDFNDRDSYLPRLLDILRNGCRYFVCVGDKAESLHDAIDDLIVGEDVAGVIDVTGTITTFHSRDEIDDLSFFIFDLTKQCKNASTAYMLVVEPEFKETKRLISALTAH